MKLRFLDEARFEFDEAVDYYEEKDSDLVVDLTKKFAKFARRS